MAAGEEERAPEFQAVVEHAWAEGGRRGTFAEPPHTPFPLCPVCRRAEAALRSSSSSGRSSAAAATTAATAGTAPSSAGSALMAARGSALEGGLVASGGLGWGHWLCFDVAHLLIGTLFISTLAVSRKNYQISLSEKRFLKIIDLLPLLSLFLPL